MNEVTSEMMKDWVNREDTKWFINVLKVAQKSIEVNWSNGKYTDISSDGSAQLNSKALGASMQINHIISFMDNISDGEVDVNLTVGHTIVE